MAKLKGIKGQIIISSAGSFDTDEQKDRFKELWCKPTGFKSIDYEPIFKDSLFNNLTEVK
jgi:hypothetical protein